MTLEKVFVYGTLKFGFPNHYIIQNSKKLGVSSTFLSTYLLVELSEQLNVPAVILWDQSIYKCGFPILGEIYEVSPHVLATLDNFENNGLIYTREKIQLSNNMVAWMYIMNFKIKNPRIVTPNHTGIQNWLAKDRIYLQF